MALTCKAFGDIITFTRASSATFTGSNGLIQSATTNTPRFDYDPVTLAAKGLLIEEQRTNLLTYSEQFDNAAWVYVGASVTANSVISPDGTVTADTLVEDTSTGLHRILRSITLTAVAHTYSIYVKAAGRNFVRMNYNNSGYAAGYFNLSAGTFTGSGSGYLGGSMTTVGNGWYRCSITFTGIASPLEINFLLENTSGNPSYTGDGASGAYLWGAQLEAGSFATSYIPTVASQVTRSADVASVNTLSPWYNATEGTLYFEGSHSNSDNFPINVMFSDATAFNNQIVLYTTSTGTPGETLFVRAGGVAQANINGGGIVANNVTFKLGGAYKANDFAVSLNGASAVTDTSGSVPTVDRMFIGSSVNQNSLWLNGHIRRITYYPRRLSNAELQAITA